jgi:rhombotail lipoprotein
MKVSHAVCAVVFAFSLCGCAAFQHLMCAPNCSTETRHSSSLVEFLYPNGATPPAENAIPQLRVPLRVGLSFLPESEKHDSALTAAQKDELMERIRTRFKDRKFVTEIVVIPDYYLKAAHGFAGLKGVQRLYNVDLMALVSYDQVAHSDDNQWSLGYLTIVGAYVLKGSRHDTTTLVDLAVVDPATLSLVLRAGGTDTRHGNTTLIEQEREARAASADGFATATGQMIENFDRALTAFETDVRAGKANVRIAQRNGPTSSNNGGGGAFDWAALLVRMSLIAASSKVRRSDRRGYR